MDGSGRRTAAERASQEQQNQIDSIFRAAPIGIGLVRERILEAVNDRICEMLGCTKSDLIGKSSRVLYDNDEDFEYVGTEKYRQIRERGTGTVETRWRCTDGRLIDVLLSSTPLDPNDLSRGVTFTALDITDRKQMEAALRTSEERMRLALQAANQGFYDLNVQTGEAKVSPEYATMLGYDPDQFVETNDAWVKRMHPNDRDRVAAVYRAYIAGDIAEYRVESRQRTKSGEWKWVLSLGKIVELDGDGRPLRMLGTHTNINDRRNAEEEREQALAMLEAAIAQSPSGMLIADAPDVRIRWANAAALGIRGVADSPLTGIEVGRHAANWQTFRPDGSVCPSEDLPLSRAVLKGETVTDELVIIRNSEGDDRWVTANAAPIRDRSGAITSGIVVFHDVTERRRAEQEKQRLQAQLVQSQRMDSIGRLAGGVAHDFNNMLGVILGHAELATMLVDESDRVYRHLTEIQKAADRSATLTKQLLAFARRQTVSPKLLDLNAAVDSGLSMLRSLIGEDIALTWTPDPGLWPVRIDPSQVDQILANLCVNARDAIDGVGTVTIQTGRAILDAGFCASRPGATAGEYVMLAVSDTGCGMDSETLSNVFEPFFTTKTAGRGTGLGLATVYGIVKQNNGYVEADSTPGEGTTFRVYLVRDSARADNASAPGEPEPTAHGTETILFVEDEAAMLEMGTGMLRSLGYRVIPASVPEEAIRLAKDHAGEITLLMTDVVMPKMNGRELADAVAAILPDIKRMYTSGYTANVIAHRGMLDEGVLFIQKPFSRDDLAAKVREALDG